MLLEWWHTQHNAYFNVQLSSGVHVLRQYIYSDEKCLLSTRRMVCQISPRKTTILVDTKAFLFALRTTELKWYVWWDVCLWRSAHDTNARNWVRVIVCGVCIYMCVFVYTIIVGTHVASRVTTIVIIIIIRPITIITYANGQTIGKRNKSVCDGRETRRLAALSHVRPSLNDW